MPRCGALQGAGSSAGSRWSKSSKDSSREISTKLCADCSAFGNIDADDAYVALPIDGRRLSVPLGLALLAWSLWIVVEGGILTSG
jgi:hypothetical protein